MANFTPATVPFPTRPCVNDNSTGWSCGAPAALASGLSPSGRRRRLHGYTHILSWRRRKKSAKYPAPPKSPQLTPKPTTTHPFSPWLDPRSSDSEGIHGGGSARVRGKIGGCTSTTRGYRHRCRPRRVGRQLPLRALCGPPRTRGCPGTPTPPTPHSSGSPCSTCNCSLEFSSLPRLRFDCFEVSFMLRSAGSRGRRPAARLVLRRLLLPNLT